MIDVTNVFSSRLKELRGERTLQEVATTIGITRVALSYYEKGERKPDIEILYKIADFYKVSSDYLIGISDIKNPDEDIRSISGQTGLSEKAVEMLTAGDNAFIDTVLTSKNFAEMDFFFSQVVFDYEIAMTQMRGLVYIESKMGECDDPEKRAELNKEYDKTYERINNLETKCESMLYRVSLRLANLLNDYREKKVSELHEVLGIEKPELPNKK